MPRYTIRYAQTEYRKFECAAADLTTAEKMWREGSGTDSFEAVGGDQRVLIVEVDHERP